MTDLSQNNAFKFAHKSFLELLLAVAEVSKIVEVPDEKVRVISRAVLRIQALQSGTPLRFMTPAPSPEVVRFGGELLNYWMRKNAKSDDSDKIIQAAVEAGLRLKIVRIIAAYFRESDRKFIGPTLLVGALYLHVLIPARYPLSVYGITDIFLRQAGGRGLNLRSIAASTRGVLGLTPSKLLGLNP